jgi:thioredoxin-related protein
MVVGLAAFLTCALGLAPGLARADSGFALVMVEQRGCGYCKAWHADVGPEYPITPEGRFAPLRVADLHALPEDLGLVRRPVFTPTFILTRDGQEIGRIEGYPGEDFFWVLLDRLLQQGDADWATQDAGG